MLARSAIAPLVLEARGPDATPAMIDKVTRAGDEDSAAALHIILTDEVQHMAVGKRWFDFVCGLKRLDPVSSWHKLVTQYSHGELKPPLKIGARHVAKSSAAVYGPLDTRNDLVGPPANVGCRRVMPDLPR